MIVCFFIIFNNLYRASLACLSIDIYYPFAAFICFADGFFIAVQLTMLTKMAVVSSAVNSVVFDVNVVVLRIAYLIQYVSSDVLNQLVNNAVAIINEDDYCVKSSISPKRNWMCDTINDVC